MEICDHYRITSLRASSDGALLTVGVEIFENGQKRCEKHTVFAARLQALPQCGALSDEEYAALSLQAEITQAMLLALRSLGACDASARHLCRKLCAKGISRDVAECAVAELLQKGYLDEVKGALCEAERGLSKLWGDRRILSELCAKGYGSEAISAVKERLQLENGAKRCAKLIARRHLTLPAEQSGAQRVIASLMRYGYSHEEIRRAFSHARREE